MIVLDQDSVTTGGLFDTLLSMVVITDDLLLLVSGSSLLDVIFAMFSNPVILLRGSIYPYNQIMPGTHTDSVGIVKCGFGDMYPHQGNSSARSMACCHSAMGRNSRHAL